MSRILRVCLAAMALAAAMPVHADMTLTDLQVAARALSFMESPPSGDVRVGIVYSPSNRSTVRQARQVNGLLDGGLSVGSINLEPEMVAVEALGDTDVDLLLLTDGLGAEAARVAAASRHRGIPCVTADIDRVRDGTCALGVRSTPRVEILVNRAAAEKSGTTFATAFRMMITEL